MTYSPNDWFCKKAYHISWTDLLERRLQFPCFPRNVLGIALTLAAITVFITGGNVMDFEGQPTLKRLSTRSMAAQGESPRGCAVIRLLSSNEPFSLFLALVVKKLEC